jgi:hypothetical protein
VKEDVVPELHLRCRFVDIDPGTYPVEEAAAEAHVPGMELRLFLAWDELTQHIEMQAGTFDPIEGVVVLLDYDPVAFGAARHVLVVPEPPIDIRRIRKRLDKLVRTKSLDKLDPIL